MAGSEKSEVFSIGDCFCSPVRISIVSEALRRSIKLQSTHTAATRDETRARIKTTRAARAAAERRPRREESAARPEVERRDIEKMISKSVDASFLSSVLNPRAAFDLETVRGVRGDRGRVVPWEKRQEMESVHVPAVLSLGRSKTRKSVNFCSMEGAPASFVLFSRSLSHSLTLSFRLPIFLSNYQQTSSPWRRTAPRLLLPLLPTRPTSSPKSGPRTRSTKRAKR